MKRRLLAVAVLLSFSPVQAAVLAFAVAAPAEVSSIPLTIHVRLAADLTKDGPNGAYITDTDGDGLVDAFERSAGLSSTLVDSDGDGRSDSSEFPLANLPTGDPLVADGVITCTP